MDLHGALYGVPRAAAARSASGQLLSFVDLADRRDVSSRILRRDEAAAGDRSRLSAPAADPVPRRADARAGPADAQPHLGVRARPVAEHQVTVFFTTHGMEEAERVADDITVIDHGRIVAEGTATA